MPVMLREPSALLLSGALLLWMALAGAAPDAARRAPAAPAPPAGESEASPERVSAPVLTAAPIQGDGPAPPLPQRRIAPGNEAYIAGLIRDPSDALTVHRIGNMRAAPDGTILVEITGPTAGTLILAGDARGDAALLRSASFFFYWQGATPVPADVHKLARGIARRDPGDFWQRVAPSAAVRPAPEDAHALLGAVHALRALEGGVAAGALLAGLMLSLRSRAAVPVAWVRWLSPLVPLLVCAHLAWSGKLSHLGAARMRLDLLGHFPAGAGLWTLALAPAALVLLVACTRASRATIASAAHSPRAAETRFTTLLLLLLTGCGLLAVGVAPLALEGLPDSASRRAEFVHVLYVLAHWAAIALVWRSCGARHRLGAVLLLGAFHLTANLLLEPRPLGDSLELRHATFAQLPRSELLSSALHAALRALFGSFAYTAPIFGALTLGSVYAAGMLADRMQGDRASLPYLVTALYAASPLPALFFHGYVENAQLALPPALLGLALLCAAAHQPAQPLAWRPLVGLLLVALAGLVHGWAVMLWSLVVVVPATRLFTRVVTWSGAGLQMLVGLAVLAATARVTMHLLLQLEFDFRTGNLLGGSDGCALVQLAAGGCWDQRYPLLSLGHLVEWARPVLLLFPAWIGAALLAIRSGVSGSAQPILMASTGVAAYLTLLFLWNFDLGYPNDFDLMASGAATLIVFTAFVVGAREAARGVSRAVRAGLLLATLLGGWVTVPSLLAAPTAPPSARADATPGAGIPAVAPCPRGAAHPADEHAEDHEQAGVRSRTPRSAADAWRASRFRERGRLARSAARRATAAADAMRAAGPRHGTAGVGGVRDPARASRVEPPPASRNRVTIPRAMLRLPAGAPGATATRAAVRPDHSH